MKTDVFFGDGMMMKWGITLGAAAFALCLFGNSAAQAESSVEFFGSSSFVDGGNTYQLKANVVFSYDSGTKELTIELTNTYATSYESLGQQTIPRTLLTGLFFDIDPSAFTNSGATDLTLNTATAEAVVNQSTGTNVDVKYPGLNGGWRYAHTTNAGGFSGTNVTQQYALGTSGFSGIMNVGSGQQLNYGIANQGYVPGQGSNPIKNNPIIQNSVVFKLSGDLLKSGFDIRRDLGNIRFQYGTEPTEPHFPGEIEQAPEPTSLALLGTGLIGVVVAARRKKTGATPAAA